MNTHIPKVVGLKLKRQSRVLQVNFDDNQSLDISCELLRVYSPSAEVQQHGSPVLVTHKKNVNIKAIEAVGNYAVKLVFDDGHDTGIYSWEVLYRLGSQQTQLWQDYLARLKAEHGSREGLIPITLII
ncbi:gamma-butyrobetaine hydroxylase-like domain-containing protein [Shewanella sp.]|uniref:gamma-butyrobetaine hydroxylase-like domain-containing protein n=1 Tax=Shewanella sp. TaxID=50422 RepID=UPI0040549E04